MYTIVDFVFRNIFIIFIIIIVYYIFRQYKYLVLKEKQINEQFEKVLDSYLSRKIQEAKQIVDSLNTMYPVEEVHLELEKINIIINKGISGTINEKVETSNALNKYKLAKNIDLNKYPDLVKLNMIGTFTEEDMQSLDNGVAIARREYNALAFNYNEKASSFFLQYLTKILKLNQRYVIFDVPKSTTYEENYEVFEEQEPQLNSISALNYNNINNNINSEQLNNTNIQNNVVNIEHSDVVLKPSVDVNNLDNEQK